MTPVQAPEDHITLIGHHGLAGCDVACPVNQGCLDQGGTRNNALIGIEFPNKRSSTCYERGGHASATAKDIVFLQPPGQTP